MTQRIINLACTQRIIMPGICTLKLLYPLVFALNFKVGGSIMTLLAIFSPAWVLLKTIWARDGYHRPNNNTAPINDLPLEQKISESTITVKTSLRAVCTASKRVPMGSSLHKSPMTATNAARVMAERELTHAHARTHTFAVDTNLTYQRVCAWYSYSPVWSCAFELLTKIAPLVGARGFCTQVQFVCIINRCSFES